MPVAQFRLLSRRAAALHRAPALDVDADLVRDRATRHVAARPRPNPHAPTDADTARPVLFFLRDAGDLDHRTFVSFDLGDQLLRPVHPEMRAIRNRDAARFIHGPAAGCEDVALGT